jgi:hypothetical protein
MLEARQATMEAMRERLGEIAGQALRSPAAIC